MKRLWIIIGITVISVVLGCGKSDVPEAETETALIEESLFSASDNAAEDDVIEIPEEKEKDSISIVFEYYFSPDETDITNSIVGKVSVMKYKGLGIYSDSGPLTYDHLNSNSIPKVSVDGEELTLTEECIDDIRKLDVDIYNDNMRDQLDSVVKAFVYASEVFDSTEKATDGFPIDYTDHMPKTIKIDIDGSNISMDVVKCELDEAGFSSGNSDESATLTTILLDFSCEADDLSVLKDYYSEIAEECKGNTGESDFESHDAKDVVIIEMPETEKDVAESDFEDEEPQTDTGIIGKWYPDYTDYSDYYIQFDEGGVGEIHQGDNVIPLTYTYSNNTVRVSYVYGNVEYYYNNGTLEFDMDGSIYRKKDK